jgi:hypothetical protein
MCPRRVVVIALALVACGSPGRPPATVVKPVAPPPPPPPVCVTPSDDATAITRATADRSHVRYCIGAAAAECFELDLETGRFARLTEPPKLAEAQGAQVVTTNPELKVCTSGTCTALTPNILPGSSAIRGAANPAGTFAVFLLGDARQGKGYAEIWDVAKTRRTATFRYARGDFRCGDVAMLGDTIYLSASQCGTPAARGGLYTLTGRKIANVGGRDFGTYGGAFAEVGGTTWAFLEENANQLVIQDIAKGKIVKTIDTSPLLKLAGAEMANPGESALVRVSDTQLAIVAGAPASGNVALVDVTTGAIRVMPAQVCKP